MDSPKPLTPTDESGALDSPLMTVAADHQAMLTELTEAHDQLRATTGWTSEEEQVAALCFDFVELVRTTAFAFTRYPEAEKWILQSSMDEYIESALAILQLTSTGVYNTAYRELRYLLESSIKFSYVDQQLPGQTPLNVRQRWLHDNVPRGSITVVSDLKWFILPEENTIAVQANDLFGQLSSYVHPSLPTQEARVRRADRNQHIGLEGVETLRKFRSDLTKALDLIAALILNGVGKQFSNDILDALLARHRWRFRKTLNISAIVDHLSLDR